MENKYEVIISERKYIVIGMEEVKKVLEKFQSTGVCVQLINEDGNELLNFLDIGEI